MPFSFILCHVHSLLSASEGGRTWEFVSGIRPSVTIHQKQWIKFLHITHPHQVWSEDDTRLFEILMVSVITDISDFY